MRADALSRRVRVGEVEASGEDGIARKGLAQRALEEAHVEGFAVVAHGLHDEGDLADVVAAEGEEGRGVRRNGDVRVLHAHEDRGEDVLARRGAVHESSRGNHQAFGDAAGYWDLDELGEGAGRAHLRRAASRRTRRDIADDAPGSERVGDAAAEARGGDWEGRCRCRYGCDAGPRVRHVDTPLGQGVAAFRWKYGERSTCQLAKSIPVDALTDSIHTEANYECAGSITHGISPFFTGRQRGALPSEISAVDVAGRCRRHVRGKPPNGTDKGVDALGTRASEMEAPDPDEDLEGTPRGGFYLRPRESDAGDGQGGKGLSDPQLRRPRQFPSPPWQGPRQLPPRHRSPGTSGHPRQSPKQGWSSQGGVRAHAEERPVQGVCTPTSPCTFKRFCGLMVQLLQKLSIRASNGPEKLFKVVKGPVTKYFPAGARRVGFSFSAPEVKNMREYIEALPDNASAVFTVGAMSHGKIESTYTDDFISVSQYPLSGACCIGRITNCLENKYDIV